ncbi:MAG: class I adenylate-forming enzyme family protein [Acidimicrobiales bacterium]
MADRPAQGPLDPLAAWAAGVPDRPALISGERSWTYSQLNTEVNRLASGLLAMGARGGERAVWFGPNSAYVVAFMHACRKAGLVAVPACYRFTAAELAYVLADSQAAVVAVDPSCAAAFEVARARSGQLLRVGVMMGSSDPFPTDLGRTDLGRTDLGRTDLGRTDLRPTDLGPTDLGLTGWDEVLAQGSPQEPPPPESYGAAMMYTSGTTGRPKGALRTRSDKALLGAMLAALGFGNDEVHLVTGPLYHAGPNAFALLTHICGGTLVIQPRFEPRQWLELVSRHRVTSTFAAPTHLVRIVSLPDDVIAGADLSSMRTLIANAAPVPYALKQEVIAKLGDGFLYEVYGSTELGLAAILGPGDQLRKPGSCGRPYGGIELKVVNDEGGQSPPGEPGELYVRTALAVDGYHGPDLAAMNSLAGGWHSVGDIAYLDEDGYLYICDRRSDLIITGGTNVYPAEVEAVICSHPGVADAAVVGLDDPEWGQRVHAAVVARPGFEVDLDELQALVADRLAGFKRPRSWEIRLELPRTESGKMMRRMVRPAGVQFAGLEASEGVTAGATRAPGATTDPSINPD